MINRFLQTMRIGLMLVGVGHASERPGDEQHRTVAVLEQAVKTDPTNSELWDHLGFAYRKLNQTDPSLNAFEKARSINPRDADALYMLGLIYESKHDSSSALKAWNDYLAATTDSTKRDVAQKHIHQLSQ